MNWQVVGLFVAALIGVMMITPVLVLAYLSNIIQRATEEDDDKWKN
jgi:hypothetical protein